MRYVLARIEENNREEAYRFYVTRSLQLAPQGKNIVPTLDDIINPKEVDERSGDEIVVDIMKRMELKFEE